MQTINGVKLNKTETDAARKGLDVLRCLARVALDPNLEAAVAEGEKALAKYGVK